MIIVGFFRIRFSDFVDFFRFKAPNYNLHELKSQNRNLNSLLCEIFTNLAVKTQKLQTQRIIYGRQNLFDSHVNQGIHHDTCIFCNCLFRMVTCGYFHFGNNYFNSPTAIGEFAILQNMHNADIPETTIVFKVPRQIMLPEHNVLRA